MTEDVTASPLRAAFEAHRFGLGTITPSGNTVVERVTSMVLRAFPEVSGCFSRTPVHGDRDPFPDSYDFDSMLHAAGLIAHARPDAIVWNGSKAGSIDFALDLELVRRIGEATGIAATTSTLALDEVLRATGAQRVALVTPYAEPYQRKVVATFGRAGYDCVAETHAGLTDNLSYSLMPLDDIAGMIRSVAGARPQAIVAFCTNFAAAPLVAELERAFRLPVYDSTLLPIWKALRLMGIDTARGREFGTLFERA